MQINPLAYIKTPSLVVSLDAKGLLKSWNCGVGWWGWIMMRMIRFFCLLFSV